MTMNRQRKKKLGYLLYLKSEVERTRLKREAKQHGLSLQVYVRHKLGLHKIKEPSTKKRILPNFKNHHAPQLYTTSPKGWEVED